jgi:hypothetical protein
VIVSRFRIRTDWTKPERWFWVRVYDTPDSLRRMANRVSEMRGGGGSEYGEALGCVQETVPWIPDDADPETQDDLPVTELVWPEDGFAGVIRLCRDWLTPEILAHEILHAAVTVFRMNICQRPQLEGMLAVERNQEEALAYTVGQLHAGLVNGLRENGWE